MTILNISIATILSTVVILLEVNPIKGGRILYLAFPQFSHLQVFTCVKEELKQYGHELWIACPEYLYDNPALKDVNLIKLKKLGPVNIDKTFFADMVNVDLNPEKVQVDPNPWLRLQDYIRSFLTSSASPFHMMQAVRNITLTILSDTEFIETVKEKKFDLVVVDGALGAGLSILPYTLGIPFCYISILQLHWHSGTPTLPSFIPVTAIGTTDRMTFMQRVTNMLIHIWLMNKLPFVNNDDVSTFASEQPFVTFNQLMGKAKMWFISQDVIMDYLRPLMPNVKLVGGICARDAKPLVDRFMMFCDKSKQGVVVVSFGGSVKELPNHLSNKLYKAFSMTKYDFVWRSTLTSKDTSKILTTDWLPQNDLLAHPNIKLFITHGGANGISESIYHGVPMLGVPLFPEQPYNTQRLQNKGFGSALDLHDNSAEEFANAINTIIQTPSYKANTMKAAAILRGRPLSPRQEAASGWIT